MRPFSNDLRQRVLEAALSGALTQAQVAQRFSVSLSFVEKLLHRHRTTGSIVPRPHGGGRQRCIQPEHEPVLLRLIETANDAIDAEIAEIAEIAERFTAATGQPVSTRTVNRMWRRLGVTRKKRHSGPASVPGRMSRPSAKPSAR